MFKHILLPTDGSPLSEAAIKKGIQFAKIIKAKVTGISVIPELDFTAYETEIPPVIKKQTAKECRIKAEQCLAVIEKEAREAGVECGTVYATSDQPYEEIINVAEEKGCDLIMMASHGRRGMKGLLIGSETQKVLTHCQIPVLVYR